MAKREFLTVPEELIEHAVASATFFESHGYKLKCEHHEIGYPYLPALHCGRGATTVLVEVVNELSVNRAREWSGYCRSTARDTRIAFVVPAVVESAAEVLQAFKELGVGIYISDGASATELTAPMDIGIQLELPPLETLSAKERRLLGPAYEQVARSQWREAFVDICQVLETQARKYFADRMIKERVVVLKKNGEPLTRTRAQGEKLTIGALVDTFSRIERPNRADTIVLAVLKQINDDRVAVTHYKTRAATERRLRKNVGQNTWRAIAALRSIL
jgi:hypothetical protein